MYKHAAFYKFAKIEDPRALQQNFKHLLQEHKLKGTILIAPEGINAMVAGEPECLDRFICEVQKDPRFSELQIKFNFTQTPPFKKIYVKVKKEILTFKDDRIDPSKKTGFYLKPKDLRSWIDQKKDFVFLDTRNKFDVDYGTFSGAVNPQIKSFTEFKDFVQSEAAASLKNKTVVTFCTGGIRCEKATAFMLECGFKDVWQIEGGILQYFQDTDGLGWDGDCFVFDERIAVDTQLKALSDGQSKKVC